MRINPLKKVTIIPKEEDEGERGTCHLDLNGVPPMPLPSWTWETPREQDGLKSKDMSETEESE